MFFEIRVKTEKEMKDSQRIMFFNLPVGKIGKKEAEKLQSSLEIGCGTSEQLFAENSFRESHYLSRETLN
jgi:hypothetical protein